MNMKSYESYKDSGVRWIGSVPDSWSVKGLFHSGLNISTGKVDVNIQNDEGEYPFFTCSRDVKKSLNYSFDCEALLVSGNGEVGHTAYYNGKFEAYQRTYVLNNFSDFNPLFLKYYFQSKLKKYLEDRSMGSVIQFITLGDIRHFKISTPNILEQNKIVLYLNKQTLRIDTLISKQEKLIELLKEKRQAIISHAATKGLDPDVQMKDSGVEWLGEIPSDWRISPLKHVIGFQEGPGILAVDFHDIGIPLLRISCIQNDTASLDGCNYLDPEKVKLKWNHFKLNSGDLLISASASMGVISEVTSETEGAIPYTGIIRLFPKKNITKNFIKLFLKSDSFLRQIDDHKSGSTIQHFGPVHLNKMVLAIPPLQKQELIVEDVIEKTKKIDNLILKTQKSIELAKEHRSALISAAVTGKIDVRDFDLEAA